MKPTLSICIPTYNRQEYLQYCLESITSQIQKNKLTDYVEIVISDNASTDRTEDIVREFQNKYQNIFYHKNLTNVGFDKNLLTVVDKSSGEYCLTLGDDDAFLPETLHKLLQKIQEHGSHFFILNSWGYNHTMEQPLTPKPNQNITHDTSFKTLSDFMNSIKKHSELVGNFGGISTQLFLRDMWSKHINKEQFLGTQCIHLFLLLSIFKESPFTIIAEPYIKTRPSNVRWETFSGLETASKRLQGTVTATIWIKNTYNLPVSSLSIQTHLLIREYWFTLKEVTKTTLLKIGLNSVTTKYREVRQKLFAQQP